MRNSGSALNYLPQISEQTVEPRWLKIDYTLMENKRILNKDIFIEKKINKSTGQIRKRTRSVMHQERGRRCWRSRETQLNKAWSGRGTNGWKDQVPKVGFSDMVILRLFPLKLNAEKRKQGWLRILKGMGKGWKSISRYGKRRVPLLSKTSWN